MKKSVTIYYRPPLHAEVRNYKSVSDFAPNLEDNGWQKSIDIQLLSVVDDY